MIDSDGDPERGGEVNTNPLKEAKIRGRRVCLDLWYPTVADNPNEVEIGLMDVRAADTILVRYDFERDGWSILQASTFEWGKDGAKLDSDWQEVAFIEAWARENEQRADG
jgi:hypothetical protein